MKEQPYILPNVTMSRTGNQLLIKLRGAKDGTYQLLVGDRPNAKYIKEVAVTNHTGEFEIASSRADLPKYFVIRDVDSDFSTNLFAER
ncbi:hypothetical protein EQ500_10700, partial [Lactobacillus sp. XV13L]|nr:hypothetical protein [Lactobacillus sp. XV13L]